MNISKEAREAAGKIVDTAYMTEQVCNEGVISDIVQSAIDAHDSAQWRPADVNSSDLPEDHQEVLTIAGVDVFLAIRQLGIWTRYEGVEIEPTHWRELPHPPT